MCQGLKGDMGWSWSQAISHKKQSEAPPVRGTERNQGGWRARALCSLTGPSGPFQRYSPDATDLHAEDPGITATACNALQGPGPSPGPCSPTTHPQPLYSSHTASHLVSPSQRAHLPASTCFSWMSFPHYPLGLFSSHRGLCSSPFLSILNNFPPPALCSPCFSHLSQCYYLTGLTFVLPP